MDGSWATVNFANTNPVLAGFSNSISVSCSGYSALALYQTPSSSAPYTNLTFWLNGGPTGGQNLTVYGTLNQDTQTPYPLPPLAANTWQEFMIPLSDLGVADATNFDGIWILSTNDLPIPVFYVDDIFLLAGPPVAPPPPPPRPTNIIIYSNSLINGWGDDSYNTTRNFSNVSPVHTGSTNSISVSITRAYGGIQLTNTPFSDTNYASLSFWLNGGTNGGQQLQMYGTLGSQIVLQNARFPLNAPIANTWVQYIVPLAALEVANATNFSGFAIQDGAGGAESTFYLDDIELVNATAPNPVLMKVSGAQVIRTADARWFGLNTAVWDSELDTPGSMLLITNMGVQSLAFSRRI